MFYNLLKLVKSELYRTMHSRLIVLNLNIYFSNGLFIKLGQIANKLTTIKFTSISIYFQ